MHFFPLMSTSFSSQSQMKPEVSGHTAFNTYCLRDRCVCENICFQECFYILTLTYLSNCKYICFIACVAVAGTQYFPRTVPFIYSIFPRILYLLNYLEQFVYLFATSLHIFSSLHFLAPVNENMSLTSEPSFEKNLLCA